MHRHQEPGRRRPYTVSSVVTPEPEPAPTAQLRAHQQLSDATAAIVSSPVRVFKIHGQVQGESRAVLARQEAQHHSYQCKYWRACATFAHISADCIQGCKHLSHPPVRLQIPRQRARWGRWRMKTAYPRQLTENSYFLGEMMLQPPVPTEIPLYPNISTYLSSKSRSLLLRYRGGH